MGFLTTVTLYNDALNDFEASPKEFAEALFAGIYEANKEGKEIGVPFNGYCNYIQINPSRHADDHTIYVHYGNSLLNLNPYNKDYIDILARGDLKTLESYINAANRILKDAKKKLKEAKLAAKLKKLAVNNK